MNSRKSADRSVFSPVASAIQDEQREATLCPGGLRKQLRRSPLGDERARRHFVDRNSEDARRRRQLRRNPMAKRVPASMRTRESLPNLIEAVCRLRTGVPSW